MTGGKFMDRSIIKNYRKNDKLRISFNTLAKETFGLDFEPWYHSGFWNEKYIPYSVLCEGRIISNVSVNLIDCEYAGRKKRYIQLGTVMTDKKYRHKGYIRMLMEEIRRDYSGCDGFFLYANDSVCDFYPKFDFEKAEEYRFRAEIHTSSSPSAIPVSMQTSDDWTHFLKEKKQRKSSGVLNLDTDDLLMFYLTQFMKDHVFYIPSPNCYVIAEADNDILTVYDIFSEQPVDIISVCSCFGAGIKSVDFAFTPDDTHHLEKYLYREDDSTFFILGEGLKQDMKHIGAFPAVAHA